MKEIIIYILIFYAGLIIGYLLRVWLTHKFTDYTGTIIVTHEEEKTVYSLILDDYPDVLQFKKEVVFRVDAADVELSDAPDESPNRE
jgi:hypothetical protein